MPVAAAGITVGYLAPKDAIAAFVQRKLLVPTFNWQALWHAEHADAFTVAKLLRLDLVSAIYDGLAAAMAEGSSLADFEKKLQPLLEKEGWWGKKQVINPVTGEIASTTFNSARLGLIYDVNTRQSYAAGRWRRIEAGKAVNPFVIYRTMRDERVRSSHAAWDGLVLPVGHPFWKTHYAPNGWRCRCRCYAIDEDGIATLKAAGFKIKTDAPEIKLLDFNNRATGEVLRVAEGIDPGFAYNAGMARREALSQQLKDAYAKAPQSLARAEAAQPSKPAKPPRPKS